MRSKGLTFPAEGEHDYTILTNFLIYINFRKVLDVDQIRDFRMAARNNNHSATVATRKKTYPTIIRGPPILWTR